MGRARLESNGHNLSGQAHLLEISLDLRLVDRVHEKAQIWFVPLEKGRRNNLLPGAGHVFTFAKRIDVDYIFDLAAWGVQVERGEKCYALRSRTPDHGL